MYLELETTIDPAGRHTRNRYVPIQHFPHTIISKGEDSLSCLVTVWAHDLVTADYGQFRRLLVGEGIRQDPQAKEVLRYVP